MVQPAAGDAGCAIGAAFVGANLFGNLPESMLENSTQ